MARAGCIAAFAGLLTGCLSSPPGGAPIDGSPPDAGPPAADAGFTIVETLPVLGNCTVLTSEKTLEAGVSYRLAVDGVISLGGEADAEAAADAEYFWFVTAPETIGDSTVGVDFGLAVDDIVIDEERVPDWGDYRSDHRYGVEFIGLGDRINAQFHDNDCGNNSGTLNLVVLGPPG